MREVCSTSVCVQGGGAKALRVSPLHTIPPHTISFYFFYQNLLSFSWRDLHSTVVDFFSPFISFLSLFNKDSFLGGKADSVVFFEPPPRGDMPSQCFRDRPHAPQSNTFRRYYKEKYMNNDYGKKTFSCYYSCTSFYFQILQAL